MRILTILVLIMLMFSTSLFCQDQNILWQNTIGGTSEDIIWTGLRTSNGDYLFGGSSTSNISGDKTEDSNGSNDVWLVLLDTSGNIIWQSTIGGIDYDALGAFEQTADGGFILACTSDSDISGDKTENSKGHTDYWIIKLDATGEIEWQNTIGGTAHDQARDIIQTIDGGYVVGGRSASDPSDDKSEFSFGGDDYWVVKLNSVGQIEWENTIQSWGQEDISFIGQTSDGAYFVCGVSDGDIGADKTENSNGSQDIWILKLNSVGEILWQNTIGGSGVEWAHSALLSDDQGYILAGTSNSDISGDKLENSRGEADFWILKLNAAGDLVWQKTLGGNAIDVALTVYNTDDKGYVVGGWSLSGASGEKTEANFGSHDFWLVKLTNTGALEWENTIGGSDNDVAHIIFQDVDGLVIGGTSRSNISFDKTEDKIGGHDYWVVKHSNNFLGVRENQLGNQIYVIPNPTSHILHVKSSNNNYIDTWSIFDFKGVRVLHGDTLGVIQTLDVSSLSAGIYYLQFSSQGKISTEKFIKE